MNKVDGPKLRARVFVRGATESLFYGKNQASLERNAIKALTTWEPGGCSLHPERIEIAEQVRTGELTIVRWKVIKTIHYADVPESQHEWRRRKERHASARKTV